MANRTASEVLTAIRVHLAADPGLAGAVSAATGGSALSWAGQSEDILPPCALASVEGVEYGRSGASKLTLGLALLLPLFAPGPDLAALGVAEAAVAALYGSAERVASVTLSSSAEGDDGCWEVDLTAAIAF